MATNPQLALGAIAQAWGLGAVHEGPATRKPLVAMARDRGSGGDEIGRGLAAALEVECYDKELIDRIATLAHADKRVIETLDETVKDRMELWLSSMLLKQRYSSSDYLRSLVHVVVGIAPLGGVIVGRACHLILERFRVFRVRVVGSPERCAQRLADQQGGGDLDKLVKEAKTINAQRAQFVLENFKVRLDDATQFDLVINTDGYDDLAKAVEILTAAYWHHKASARVGEPVATAHGR